jgi:hypothetical protein
VYLEAILLGTYMFRTVMASWHEVFFFISANVPSLESYLVWY